MCPTTKCISCFPLWLYMPLWLSSDQWTWKCGMALPRSVLKESWLSWEESPFCSFSLPMIWKLVLMAGSPAAILYHEMTFEDGSYMLGESNRNVERTWVPDGIMESLYWSLAAVYRILLSEEEINLFPVESTESLGFLLFAAKGIPNWYTYQIFSLLSWCHCAWNSATRDASFCVKLSLSKDINPY